MILDGGRASACCRYDASMVGSSVTRSWISVWPPVPPSVFARRPRRELPFPLGDPRCRLYSRARHGLWQAIRAHGLGDGDQVLVPDFHHGSEVEALVRAGLEPRFYGLTELLEPDVAQLDNLVGPRVRALYLIHYLGFPQDVVRWRRWADDHGLLLVEDAAQSWLSAHDGIPVGSLGDIAIFCLYKTLGLSEGGAVVVARPLTSRSPVPGRGLRDLGYGLRRWLRQRWDVRRTFGPSTYVAFAPAEDAFELGEPDSVPSQAAAFVVARLADVAIAERRRSNYRILLDELRAFVPSGFAELPPGASPLQFPVRVRDKATVLERLADAGIEAADVWPRAHPLGQSEQSERTQELRSKLVGLPVHHELRETELHRIASAARTAMQS
jgi:dTDP-4-amino-4,6-dideoxygalactose transaminase